MCNKLFEPLGPPYGLVRSCEDSRKTKPQVFKEEKAKEKGKGENVLEFFTNHCKATPKGVIMHSFSQPLTLITKSHTTHA